MSYYITRDVVRQLHALAHKPRREPATLDPVLLSAVQRWAQTVGEDFDETLDHVVSAGLRRLAALARWGDKKRHRTSDKKRHRG